MSTKHILPLAILAGLLLCTNLHAQLYVAQDASVTVGEYDATTGTAINANFITAGLSEPEGLLLSGNTLFVTNNDNGTVGEYDATTGTAISANFITGVNQPSALALSGNNLYVASFGTVGEYNATTGTAINANFITGLADPSGLAVAPVPEPATWAMLAMGGAGLLIAVRRRLKARLN